MRGPSRNFWWFVIGIIAMVFVVALMTVIVQGAQATHAIREQQIINTRTTQTSAKTLRVNTKTLRLIQSCVKPGGSCYDRGQAQTADAVGQINHVVILAAACASQHPGSTTDQVQTCVMRGLAKQEAKK